LINILNAQGSVDVAKMYVNSDDPRLAAAAKTWAQLHNCIIETYEIDQYGQKHLIFDKRD